MGRDWKYYWGGGGAGLGGRSGTTKTTTKSNNNNHDKLVGSPSGAPTGCCINSLFHLFHFQSSFSFCHHHHHQLTPSTSFKQEQQQPPLASTTTIKVAEAPRNSSPPPMPIEELAALPFLNIPNQIKIGSSRRTEDLSSECSSSPALKSPNLVARLMGLDLLPLPDQTIPFSSSISSSFSSIKSRNYQAHLLKHSKTLTNNNKFILDIDFMGSRSLPETPRISTERISTSKLDYHHRLSLQINNNNRENIVPEFEQSRNSTGRRDVRVLLDEEENRSPGFFARQKIVKKVKDNIISRKVGSDITNTVNNSNRQSHHQKQIIQEDDYDQPNKQYESTSSCSPRLRFLELKNRGVSPGRDDKPKPSPKEETHQSSSDKKCGGIRKEIRRDQVLCINRQSSETIKKKEETLFQSKEKLPAFKKCKKPKLFYAKSLPDQKQKQKQEYDAGCSSERRSVQAKRSTVLQNGRRGGIGTVGNQSITETTCTAGINITPIIYESVEKTVLDRLGPELMSYESSLSLFDGSASVPNMSLRCNRLLIFDLVNELLQVEISRMELSDNHRMLKGPDLVQIVCQKIQNFPAANCIVLEDVDKMIERKLAIVKDDGKESEGITEEIEREIIDNLLKETTSLFYQGFL